MTFGTNYWQGCALTPQVGDAFHSVTVLYIILLYVPYQCCVYVFLFCYSGAEIRSVCTEAGMFAIRSRRKVCENKAWLL